MDHLFKFLGWLFAVLFLLGAVVQFNDPDALVWIFIYLTAASVSVLCALGKLSAKVPLGFGVVAFIGFLYLYPSDFQGFGLADGDIKTVELGREAFALLHYGPCVLGVWLSFGKTIKNLGQILFAKDLWQDSLPAIFHTSPPV
jgi:hypothetical protein